MDINKLFVLEVTLGLIVTTLVTVFYGVLAPWYKQSAGRYIFGLLLSLTLVLANAVLRTRFSWLDPDRYLSVFLFAVYIAAISFVGYGIYNAQIGRYRRKKFVQAEKERHRQL